MNNRENNVIYFDNAATTFPKPPQVYEAVKEYMRAIGVSAGRSAYRLAVAASRTMFDARVRLGALFGVKDAGRIVFTSSATEALNLALLGSLNPEDRVAISSLEHNSVMRPLRFLQNERRVKVDIVECDPRGVVDLSLFENALRKRPNSLVVNHGSNVVGSIAPLAEIGALCRKYGVRFFVDAAQTAGLIPIDVEESNIDFLCFSGHKNLYGLQGVGGLYIREGLDPRPLLFGGTGSRSESDEQPCFMPDRYESGTRNMPGIASIASGVEFIERTGITEIFNHGSTLLAGLIGGLSSLSRVHIFGPKTPGITLPTLSITVEGIDNGTVAQLLNDEFNIAVRVGLHCAPMAHRTIGTFPAGTIRISLGYFNTGEDCSVLIAALEEICRKY